MKTYKVCISYDGTHYFGWQEQPTVATAAGVMQHSFLDLFGHEITLVGASRTDGGVHALGQVARFHSPLDIEPQKMRDAWNAHLPRSIQIRSLDVVDQTFHPQHDVDYKIYQYHISTKRPLPFIAPYVLWHPRAIDLKKIQEASQLFIGTHDFRSFCTGTDFESTVRTINSIKIEYLKRYNIYRVTVKGPGFLRYMIRRIVGALLFVASRKDCDIRLLTEILEKKNPAHQFPTAPARGLVLRKIVYKGSHD